ncbi:MAG: ribosome maturation factor RimM [Bacilli bacterium]
MEYLKLGSKITAFGLKGGFKIYSSTFFQSIRYQQGNTIYIKKDEQYIPLTVKEYFTKGNFDFIQVEEFTTIEQLSPYLSLDVYCEKDDNLTKEGYYYFSDLKKCYVYDENNNLLGKVKEVEEFPAQITLRIQRENNKDFFVPFIKQFIISIDINKQQIVIKVIEGML